MCGEAFYDFKCDRGEIETRVVRAVAAVLLTTLIAHNTCAAAAFTGLARTPNKNFAWPDLSAADPKGT